MCRFDGHLSLGQLVELKNGETYNGHLVNCDTWMNIHLREVICTSKVKAFFFLIFVYFVLCFQFWNFDGVAHIHVSYRMSFWL